MVRIVFFFAMGSYRVTAAVGAGEATGRDHLGCADPTVLVGVDQRQGLLVELEPLHRAGEGDPELLVELSERDEIDPPIEANLIEATCAEETPAMRRGHRAAKVPLRLSGCKRAG